MAMGIELTDLSDRGARYVAGQHESGLGSRLRRYIRCRLTHDTDELPDLPVPVRFRQTFRDWAEGRVNFVEFLEE